MRAAALVACSALAASATDASAQAAGDYPVKPVRVIVGQAPGGGTDIQARLFAQKLSERFGRGFVIENRTGGGSVLAYRTIATAVPDGYTPLSAELAKSAKAPDLVARLAPDGSEPVGSAPDELRAFIVRDIARWREVVRKAGIRLQ